MDYCYNGIIDEMSLFRNDFDFLNNIDIKNINYQYAEEKENYLDQFLPEREIVKKEKTRILDEDYLISIYKSKQIIWY